MLPEPMETEWFQVQAEQGFQAARLPLEMGWEVPEESTGFLRRFQVCSAQGGF